VLQRPVESAQYVSLIFGQSARAAGIDISMGAKGCALDTQSRMRFLLLSGSL